MFVDKDKYTSHIKDQDKILEMRRLIDKIEIVLKNHMLQSTEFLDPYERRLAKSILNRFDDLEYVEQGGLLDAERKTIIMFPFYQDKSDLEDNVVVLKVNGNLQGLTHKDYLGAVLNLGIKRNKIGDILVHNDYGYIVVKPEIADFLLINLEKIGNQNTIIKRVELESIEPIEHKFKEINITLSSYRVDVYLSSVYNLSRQKSSELIKSNLVKVNWEPTDKQNKELSEGDIISARGYGRSILYSVDGISKKGKIKANVRILI